MLLIRVTLIIVGLLSVARILAPIYIVPSLERWTILAGTLALIWAAILGFRPRRWHTIALGILLGAGLLYYAVIALVEVGTVALALPALELELWPLLVVGISAVLTAVLAIIVRAPHWEWLVGIGLFWSLGTAAQLFWGTSDPPIDGWLRLSSLVALPMLSILAHRQLLTAPTGRQDEGPLTQAIPLMDLVKNLERARELEPALIVASSRLADLMQVGICAVALDVNGEEETDEPSDDIEGDKVRVVAVHPPTAAQIVPPQLHVGPYEGLRVAHEEGIVAVANSAREDPWIEPLYDVLGFEETPPLAVVPLKHRQQSLGLLMLGDPQGRHWREEDLGAISRVADMVAEAMVEATTRPKGPLAIARQAQTAEAEQIEKFKQQAKSQVQALNTRIQTLVQEIKARDDEILALNSELESRGQGVSPAELEVWQNEVRQLADEREVFQRKIKELTQDRDVLLDDRARLSDELVQVREYLAQVEDHRESLEQELAKVEDQMSKRREQVSDLEARLSDAQEELQTSSDIAIHQGAVGLVIVDEDGQIMMADALARQMLRLPEGDVIGMPINGAYPDPRWTQTIDDLLEPNSNGAANRAHLTLSIEENIIEADLAGLRGRDGEVDGLTITLRSSESEAERYEAITSVASEFRTPMTAITGYTDLLLGEQAGILTEMQQQFLERVKANVEQLNQLLNDLIQVASPDTRPVELSPQPVSLIEIIEEAIMGLAARFRERKLAVQLDLPEELSLVEADRDSLYQIILRLLSNAVLCSEEGSQIVVSAHEEVYEEDGRHLQISVTDTGGGIAPDDYPRVFRRFYRANQPLVEGMGETGVGMAMAKALVEANGGRIWVDSEPGAGSTFSFLLPVDS
jgi:signal transduction histidine kinase